MFGDDRLDRKNFPASLAPQCIFLRFRRAVCKHESARNMLTIILTLLVSLVSIALMLSFFNRKNQFEVRSRTVIVTGGSQGLGLSLAKQLAIKGANVVIVAQNVSKLEAAHKEIEALASKSQRFLNLSFDLRSPDSADQIVDRVTKWNDGQPPDVLINCAGYCEPGFFASSSIEQHRTQMDTVYWTCAYMAHAILRTWTTPSKKIDRTRHVIFVSSVLALFPVAGYAAYNPPKAAMRSLADTLNQEVAVYNGARLSSLEERQ
jgi:3-dehydrosphinganine reductase